MGAMRPPVGRCWRPSSKRTCQFAAGPSTGTPLGTAAPVQRNRVRLLRHPLAVLGILGIAPPRGHVHADDLLPVLVGRPLHGRDVLGQRSARGAWMHSLTSGRARPPTLQLAGPIVYRRQYNDILTPCRPGVNGQHSRPPAALGPQSFALHASQLSMVPGPGRRYDQRSSPADAGGRIGHVQMFLHPRQVQPHCLHRTARIPGAQGGHYRVVILLVLRPAVR